MRALREAAPVTKGGPRGLGAEFIIDAPLNSSESPRPALGRQGSDRHGIARDRGGPAGPGRVAGRIPLGGSISLVARSSPARLAGLGRGRAKHPLKVPWVKPRHVRRQAYWAT